MSALRNGLVLVLALSLTAASAAPPSAEDIARAVEQLGDKNFQVREKATTFLRAAGKAAEPALRDAAKSGDREVSRRAVEILDEFKWGVYPDTPKKIVELVQRYRTGDANAKRAAVADLARMSSAGYSVLLKIIAAEDTPELRAEVRHFLVTGSDRAIPVLLAEGSYPIVEEVLELGLGDDNEPALRHYVAYLQLRGRLDAKIAALKEPADKRGFWVLANLLRARGDFPAARQAAEKADRPYFVDTLLIEQGDWKELAKRATSPDRPPVTEEQYGFLAAFHRLSGQKDEYEKAVAELRRIGGQDTGNFNLAAKELLLNDRPDEAISLLKDKKGYLPAFELLAGQQKYREAIALVEKIDSDEREPALALELRKAHVLNQTGAKDKALEILDRVANEFKDGENFFTYRDLVKAELRMGLRDRALQHAAHVLDRSLPPERVDQMLGTLFADHSDSAGPWFKFFTTRYPEEKVPETLKRVRALLGKSAADEEMMEACREMERSAVSLPLPERGAWLMAAAEACLAAGADEPGVNYLEKAVLLSDGPAALERLGDYLAGKKRWKEAAHRYGQAWEQDRMQPLPLHLRGWALTQAGDQAEGRRLMELAHLIPLGNEQARFTFSQALARRGQTEAARRERELVLRLGRDDLWENNEALRQTAYDLMASKQFLKAADAFERFRLRCLRAGTSFVDYRAYLHVPVLIHQNRARGLIAAGKLDEARAEWQVAQRLVPGQLDLTILLTGDLDRAGHKTEADAVFRDAFALHEKLCADYPRSPALHNSAAWLAAGGRRELEKGLTFAAHAVELAPDQASLLDTQAELYFQHGDKDKALELVKRCRKLEPHNDYYRKQQERIEAGDPKADLPDGGQ